MRQDRVDNVPAFGGWRASGEGTRRRPETADRLRARVHRVDEIAFQVRAEHARVSCRSLLPRAGNLLQKCRQDLRLARNRGRAERCHSGRRQPRGDFIHASGRQHVVARKAVHVHIHKTRHDEAARHVDPYFFRREIARTGHEIDDTAVLDDERAAVLQAVGQDERGAGKEDPRAHWTGLGASSSLRPRSGIRAASGARMTSRSKSRNSRRIAS
jgi:hypothetical protein